MPELKKDLNLPMAGTVSILVDRLPKI